LRKKIFEDGITTCDVFFVYLTENSINSAWVQRELDSAFAYEMELKNSFLLLYVDNASSREKLMIDLKTLNIPEFNVENYLIPFGKMLSKTWNIYSKNLLKRQESDNRIKILELENKLLKLNQNSNIDFDKVKQILSAKNFELRDKSVSLLSLFVELKDNFANGCNDYPINSLARDYLVDEDPNSFDCPISNEFYKKYKIWDFTGELILRGLVETKTDQELNQFYYLTKQGVEFLSQIE